MIRLTRINKTSLAVNCDMIKFVESAPDTVITLNTGEKIVVSETVDRVIELIIEFRRSVTGESLFPTPSRSGCGRTSPPLVQPASDGDPRQ